MATIKTAISLQDTLFTQVEEIAHTLQMSRSQLVSLVLEAVCATIPESTTAGSLKSRR